LFFVEMIFVKKILTKHLKMKKKSFFFYIKNMKQTDYESLLK